MPITERGRLVFGKIDERGKKVFTKITEQGHLVTGATVTPPVTGTHKTFNYALLQNLCEIKIVNPTMQQTFYSNKSTIYSAQQSIYRSTSTTADIKQSIFNQQVSDHNTKQLIFKNTAIAFDILQEIFNGSVVKTTSFALRMEIYISQSTPFSMRQEVFKTVNNLLSLRQEISRSVNISLQTKQVVSKVLLQHFTTLQSMYINRTFDYALLQEIDSEIKQFYRSIRLMGKRKMYVYLSGILKLHVRLKGGLGMTATNQSFTMMAGDSLILTVSVTDENGQPLSLTGASVKWVAKKRVNSLENDILKTSDNGVSITGSELKIKLDPTDTKDLSGTYYHECELTDSVGNVSTIFKGYVTVEKTGV
ncbi:hypothetical protein [Peribacillus kribbensis]|uniref:hypothetical protein n=1 Tax=Peribacillus kribbensis TaxID=356658 RepID=UPI0004263077|nr:hypothetical protein [Peribacillus kribbensis]